MSREIYSLRVPCTAVVEFLVFVVFSSFFVALGTDLVECSSSHILCRQAFQPVAPSAVASVHGMISCAVEIGIRPRVGMCMC